MSNKSTDPIDWFNRQTSLDTKQAFRILAGKAIELYWKSGDRIEEWNTIDGSVVRVLTSVGPDNSGERIGYDMAEKTGISWATSTFNPWIGCSKVSQGCANCYAETLMDARINRVKWGTAKRGGTRSRTSPTNWQDPLSWNSQAAISDQPWRVFCSSLADVFEDFETAETSLEAMRADLFDLIEKTPNLIWMLLTKRPQNVLTMMPSRWRRYGIARIPDNVWIGTSIEDQKTASERLPLLEAIPSKVRWVSAEPLLGLIDLDNEDDTYKWIDWLIVGGESGQRARPMHPLWAQRLYGFAKERRIPFHFKQWGEWVPTSGQSAAAEALTYCILEINGNYTTCTRAEAMRVLTEGTGTGMAKIGKKNAGAGLFRNDQEIKEFPPK